MGDGRKPRGFGETAAEGVLNPSVGGGSAESSGSALEDSKRRVLIFGLERGREGGGNLGKCAALIPKTSKRRGGKKMLAREKIQKNKKKSTT